MKISKSEHKKRINKKRFHEKMGAKWDGYGKPNQLIVRTFDPHNAKDGSNQRRKEQIRVRALSKKA